ncbi:relaxase/mobilization nuclease domain-containing protein [Acinetobacter baumannii]|uniref:relaxase/mobilization nuclease domain-containing protein n=1 Tax=Acinetobacter baumannii TaxID=470 RepID=UPI000F65C0A8|nr:relaxase/mobilization nuclease domain-containing protein [Acinetobacter baumannii]RSF45159.1 hypothetical protein EGU08_14290 [Acinetobacter baumannii]RSF57156.1 hypothetical protein EGU00_14375 [Acinetobacter baumannii]
MHIKFLAHGKGSATHASAYLLDDLDHKGQVRAGIEVLRGDATTFNSICNSSRHLWKYTSGIIAWSKDDAPTNEQIHEVLTEFEAHAFAGLDPSQYHLFAVQHTDDDGSKHIHVLVPRLDLASGKSLNIAPPGHEAHFDALRDYFNTKYDWSRPDDISLSNLTQEPNYVIKLNKHAEKIIPKQDLGKLKKKQFYKFIDMQIRELLKKGEIQNRSDIIAEIEHLNGVKSVKAGKDYISVKIDNEKETTHRLRGDFYHEDFEIGAYAERLREAEGSRPTECELAAAIKDAERLLDSHRAKRAAYHAKHHAFRQDGGNDQSHRIEFNLDFDRDREPFTPTPENDNGGLSGAARDHQKPAITYRFIENQNAFRLSPSAAGRDRQGDKQHFDRSEANPSPNPISSKTSDREPSGVRTDRDPVTITVAESQVRGIGSYSGWSADAFNEFIYNLSVQYKPKDNPSAKRNDSTEFTKNTKSNQYFEQPKEISDADRNRLLPSRTKRIIESTKRLLDAGKQFIKDHLGFIQETTTRLEQQNQQLGRGERNKEGINFSDEIGIFKARAREFFSRFSAEINSQFQHSISKVMDEGLRRAGLSEYAKKYGANGAERGKDAAKDSSLEGVADACSERLQQRNWGDEYLAKRLKDRIGECNDFGQELDRLATEIRKIRPKPKPATDFETLRYDIYYRQYTSSHKEFSAQQDYAYQNGRKLDVIHIIKRKSEKLKDYMNQARNMLYRSDYELIEKIIKNDERMLKYLECDAVLESQNVHLKTQRSDYRASLDTFEEIKATIEAVKSSKPKITPQSNELVSDQRLDLKPPTQDFDLNS